MGAASTGMSKVNASIVQLMLTSCGSRVRLLGTIAMSSNAYALRARFARPISMSLTAPPYPGCGRPTRRGAAGAATSARVVGRLHDHLDVVGVGFLEARRGDAHELAALLELVDRAGADVEHRLAQPAHELVDDDPERAPVGHATLDALGDQLRSRGHIGLEVAVTRVRRLLAAIRERAERAHAARSEERRVGKTQE